MPYQVFHAGDLSAMTREPGLVKLFRSGSERFWVNAVTKDRDPHMIAEMHDNEADIYIVLDGEFDLHLGGMLVEPNSPSPGQHLGSSLQGAACHRVAKGDVIIIPEGVPHMVDARHGRFTYLVIKEDIAANTP